jgi:two-component SAPR family response regulator
VGKLNGIEAAIKIREIDKKDVEIIFISSLVKYIKEVY